ncbi:MAG: hypothetical protein F4051_10005 [Boseongicola sp. SB0670_bin_30]|nr:hypothetical protein [Boseongicola sp. SB0670_bin_30]
MTVVEIVRDIRAHINKCGAGPYGWYVGIAADPKDRLFNDHQVSERNGAWIHRPANSSASARKAEKQLLEDGHEGGSGGGDENTTHVYAYKITASTDENA